MKLNGYRFSATGVFGYDFYDAQKELCTVSGILAPSMPVTIRGRGCAWNSSLDHGTAVSPGTARAVWDSETKATVCQVVFAGAGRYELLFDDAHVSVHIESSGYAFFSGDEKIAEIRRTHPIPMIVPKRSEQFDTHLHFRADVPDPTNPANERIVLILLAFPLLRFDPFR